MAEHAKDKYVLCPFYLGTIPKEKKIRCEGICEGCVTHLAFSSCHEYVDHMESYCCGRYRECRLFQTLVKKYPEKP